MRYFEHTDDLLVYLFKLCLILHIADAALEAGLKSRDLVPVLVLGLTVDGRVGD